MYEKSDLKLIRDIVEYVPELRQLLYVEGKLDYKRERTKDNLEMIYLGLGNYALIREDLLKKMKEYEGQYDFSCFKQLVNDFTDDNIGDIWSLVKDTINK